VLHNTTTIWSGWLNSVAHTEPYDEVENFEVNISANDGIALLKEYEYVQTSGNKYTGLDSMFTVMMRLLSKVVRTDRIAIPESWIVPIREGDVSVPPATNETFLHTIIVNNDNYYDEDGDASTLLEVMEAMLGSLGLNLRYDVSVDGSTDAAFIVYDPAIMRADYSVKFNLYKISDGSFISTYNYNPTNNIVHLNKSDECGIERGTSSSVTWTPVYDKRKVTYSPYHHTELFKASLDEEDFCGYQECPNFLNSTDYHWTEDEEKWSEWNYAENPDFYINQPSYTRIVQEVHGIEGESSVVEPKQDYYVVIDTAAGNEDHNMFHTDVETPDLYGYHNGGASDVNNWGLLIKFKTMFTNNYPWSNSGQIFDGGLLKLAITIGSSSEMVFYATVRPGTDEEYRTKTWYTPSSYIDLESPQDGVFLDLDMGGINDIIKGGQIRIYVKGYVDSNINISMVRFKDFEVELVQGADYSLPSDSKRYKEIKEDDVIAEGRNSTVTITEDDGLSVKNATSEHLYGFERGALFLESSTADAYYYVRSLRKTPLTGASYTMPSLDWLLETSLANSSRPRMSVSGLDLNTAPMTGYDDLKSLTMSSFVDDYPGMESVESMEISSYDYDIADNISTLSIEEILYNNTNLL